MSKTKMTKLDPTVQAAVEALAGLDEVLGAHIDRTGPCDLRPRMSGRPHFEELARHIAFQQLAGKAAASIWGRTRALVNGTFRAESVLAVADEDFRAAGLSGSKVRSLKDLASHVHDGRLPLARIGRQADDAVIQELVQVRGIGEWTAQMFLMFQLGRLDVWPTGDFGVRNGYARLYGVELPTAKELQPLGDKFEPYRSIAAWYMWRAVDQIN